MNAAVHQRCLVHPTREAIARCPECHRPCCRECVTEHDGRFLCATCLRRHAQPERRRTLRLAALLQPVHLATGLFVAWLAWYLLGRALLLVPSDWHEGTRIDRLIDAR